MGSDNFFRDAMDLMESVNPDDILCQTPGPSKAELMQLLRAARLTPREWSTTLLDPLVWQRRLLSWLAYRYNTWLMRRDPEATISLLQGTLLSLNKRYIESLEEHSDLQGPETLLIQRVILAKAMRLIFTTCVAMSPDGYGLHLAVWGHRRLLGVVRFRFPWLIDLDDDPAEYGALHDS